ncbi:MAG: fatty acid desaturase [Candidatus Sericytochromatia bacterium]|nr:fatty acid desaturase [Candidatus Sericytochromatia bacterium]
MLSWPLRAWRFFKDHPWNLGPAVVMAIAHGLALAAPTQPCEPRFLVLAGCLYLVFGFATTLYLHRHLTHRAFELAEPLRFLGAIAAVAGLGGDPVGWVGDHRHHHQLAETPEDVHSPRRVGVLRAHFGWMLREEDPAVLGTRHLAEDVRRDAYNRLLEHPEAALGVHLAAAALVYAWGGLPGLLWGFYLPIFVAHHVVWSVNSLAHVRWGGYRNHDTDDDSVNIPGWSLVALGEGYHNNHHHVPRAARMGQRWFEVDPTAGLIWLLERLGLARQVAWGPEGA